MLSLVIIFLTVDQIDKLYPVNGFNHHVCSPQSAIGSTSTIISFEELSRIMMQSCIYKHFKEITYCLNPNAFRNLEQSRFTCTRQQLGILQKIPAMVRWLPLQAFDCYI